MFCTVVRGQPIGSDRIGLVIQAPGRQIQEAGCWVQIPVMSNQSIHPATYWQVSLKARNWKCLYEFLINEEIKCFS